MKDPVSAKASLKWQRIDGVYWSEDERFSILKATDRIHYGDWALYDRKTGLTFHKPTLRECKRLPERYILPYEHLGCNL